MKFKILENSNHYGINVEQLSRLDLYNPETNEHLGMGYNLSNRGIGDYTTWLNRLIGGSEYIITSDGKLNIKGDIYTNSDAETRGLHYLPINFGIIIGSFICRNHYHLRNFRGFPEIVTEDFDISGMIGTRNSDIYASYKDLPKYVGEMDLGMLDIDKDYLKYIPKSLIGIGISDSTKDDLDNIDIRLNSIYGYYANHHDSYFYSGYNWEDLIF